MTFFISYKVKFLVFLLLFLSLELFKYNISIHWFDSWIFYTTFLIWNWGLNKLRKKVVNFPVYEDSCVFMWVREIRLFYPLFIFRTFFFVSIKTFLLLILSLSLLFGFCYFIIDFRRFLADPICLNFRNFGNKTKNNSCKLCIIIT